jgi:hypothetical protein
VTVGLLRIFFAGRIKKFDFVLDESTAVHEMRSTGRDGGDASIFAGRQHGRTPGSPV